MTAPTYCTIPWGTLGMCGFILVSVLYSLRSEKRIYEMQEGNLEELAVLQSPAHLLIELPVKRDSLHTVQTGKQLLQKIDAVKTKR